MTTPHTPPTQAELDEWKKVATCLPFADNTAGIPEAQEALHRLITEVERLRTEHDCITKNIPCGACAEQAFCGSAMYPHDETCPIARLTKENDELRKDKERLRWILLHRSEFYNGSLTIEDVDSITAMQQKGEE